MVPLLKPWNWADVHPIFINARYQADLSSYPVQTMNEGLVNRYC